MSISQQKLTFLQTYKSQIEKEIDLYCDDYIYIIKSSFLQEHEKLLFETRIFYKK